MRKNNKERINIFLLVMIIILIGYFIISNVYFTKCSKYNAENICFNEGKSLYGVAISNNYSITFQCLNNNIVEPNQRTDENNQCKLWGYLWWRG